ncbi:MULTISPECIES: hypothetical protein [unclassified Bradyrhizobium]|uniref:hypothetical protein n=1 Tax=unclassified Bradyrhizobium TaxID=2631580 RepID=UPI0028EDFFD6|nr:MULTISPECIES: hypothetical protein [unclassified Bradyrhizobium]
MSNVTRIAAVAIAALAALSSQASARGLYPLTECGPDLSQLCRLHGSFAATPFHYNLAIYPGCIKRVAVETPRGVRYRRAVVCGAPDRPMIWW